MEIKFIPWPDGVADMLGIASGTLQERRQQGDCPQLYAPTPRTLVTTPEDVADWVKGKAVPAAYKCREATK
jgi:hypothetical protein